ncbi:MAG: ABC transporter transmembrane domain-containing protein, partial [Cyanobacteria bacterium J06649_11]
MINYLSKVLYVLGGEKAQLALLILVLTLSSFLEAIGIGLIGPFIRVASMPELINESSLLSFLYEVVSAKSEYDFIPALGLSIGIIFLLKSAIYFLSQSYIFHFTFRQKEKLISRLFNAYLLVPYSFYLKRNTASIIENIIFEVDQFTRGCLLQLLVAASSTIVITSLLLLLAQTDLSLLLLILTAVLPVFIFLKVFSKRFGKWGMARSHSNKEMIRILNHGLGSIKETRILGCESHFESQMN